MFSRLAVAPNGKDAMERLYVLGHPVAHSKSPAMYNAVYRALGLDWDYGFADRGTEEGARAFLGEADFLSINITTPWKPLAFSKAQVATSSAVLAQGANVLVKRVDGSFIADNTDGLGCVSYLKRRGVDFDGASVAVCGTGPTARAIMHACALAGAAKVTLLGRDATRTAAAVADYKERVAELVANRDANVVDAIDARYATADLTQIAASCAMAGRDYGAAENDIRAADVIIDATRLGMREGDPAPFGVDLISAGQVVFDVVYAHGETALVEGALEAGAAAFDGEGMLVAQAVATVHDVAGALDLPVDVDSIDLFQTMSVAAGFQRLSEAGLLSKC